MQWLISKVLQCKFAIVELGAFLFQGHACRFMWCVAACLLEFGLPSRSGKDLNLHVILNLFITLIPAHACTCSMQHDHA